MGFYWMELDNLSEHTGISVEELKMKTIFELENMVKEMEEEKNAQNFEDPEYRRLVKKFFYPMDYLSQWFTKTKIIDACARTGMTEMDLCDEWYVERGQKINYPYASEFLRTSPKFVPKYDSRGRELLERDYKYMDIYRISARRQGHCHGQVFEYLLYDRYPELKQYQFKFYELRNNDYEIYPQGSLHNIYVPFDALMNGDVEQIIKRNISYWKKFNEATYARDIEPKLKSEEAETFFSIVRSIGGVREEQINESQRIQRIIEDYIKSFN